MEIYLLAFGIVLNSLGLVVTNIVYYRFNHNKKQRRKRNVSFSKIN